MKAQQKAEGQQQLSLPPYMCLLCGASMHVNELKPTAERDALLCPQCLGPAGFLAAREELASPEEYAQARARILRQIVPMREAFRIKATPEVRALTRRLLQYAEAV